jgi:type II secretory pathway pseudopilin PulG
MGGFSIIETMVAVSLFIVISMVGMGSLLNANLVYQKSRDMRSIVDSLNYVMEDMSRSIRTGYNYHCLSSGENIGVDPALITPQDCNAGWALSFFPAGIPEPTPNDQWFYYISNDVGGSKIFKATGGPYYEGTAFTQMTPDEVNINPVLSYFVVTGTQPPNGDTRQPLVTIRLVGTITYQGVVSPFSLQTSVSQRLLDI